MYSLKLGNRCNLIENGCKCKITKGLTFRNSVTRNLPFQQLGNVEYVYIVQSHIYTFTLYL